METIRFKFDEKDIKEIKVELSKKDDKEMKDTIRIFCIDSIPTELDPKITETDYGFLVESNDGEMTLTYMLRIYYLITKFLEKVGDKLTNNEVNIEDLDFSVIKDEIDATKDLGYQDLINLLNSEMIEE